jgi:hypothetical protein
MAQVAKLPKMTLTENVLIGMLKENTGIHVLDSGGAYGRNWERNQFRGFVDEPDCTLSFKYDYIDVTLNLFHWLRDRLTYNPMLQSQFTRFANSKAHADDSWCQVVQDFVKMKAKKSGANPDHEEWPYAENTCNGNSLLSQVIQYARWIDDDGEHYAVQIHGGCDVRGGYTAPKMFDGDWYSLSDDDATIFCPICKARWYTDDAYHWYPKDYYIEYPGVDVLGQLSLDVEVAYNPKPFDLLPLSELSWGKDQGFYPMQEVDMFTDDMERGIIHVDTDGNGLCPYCAKGVLEAMA